MSGNIERMEGLERLERRERIESRENEMSGGMGAALVAENCNCSGFSMAAVAGALLLCLGIVVYALLTH